MSKQQKSWYPSEALAEKVKETESRDFVAACVLAVFYLGLENEVGILQATYSQAGQGSIDEFQSKVPEWFQKSWIEHAVKTIEGHPIMEVSLLRQKGVSLASTFDGHPLDQQGFPLVLTKDEEAEIALG